MRRTSAPGGQSQTVEISSDSLSRASAPVRSKFSLAGLSDSDTSLFSSRRLGTTSRGRWERDEDISTVERQGPRTWSTLILAFNAIGCVFGDIGTSPLYVFATVFPEQPENPEAVLYGVSLILWTITAIVCIKYALITLRADDHGQGGAFALFSQLKRQGDLGKPHTQINAQISQYSTGPRRSSGRGDSAAASGAGLHASSGQSGPKQDSNWRQQLIEAASLRTIMRIAVTIGVGMLFGDGILTPSVSVVSACEGILVRWPEVSRATIVGIAIGILVALFLFQRFGTAIVGYTFSPVLCLWFLANSLIGIYNIAKYQPGIFKAISPHYWFLYFLNYKKEAWRSLGGVFLCVTGAEALFADLGHFNRAAIRLSFFGMVYPALILTYLGQAAYLIVHPENVSTAFWSAIPHGLFYPVFIIATLAAIIASQALISAVFQIFSQAITQGFLPRLHVHHTSAEHKGQVYIPIVNYLLMVLCIIVVATFQTSFKLTRAYGLAIVCDMLLTTHYMTLIMLTVWKAPILLPLAFYIVFFTIEGLFLSATAEVPTGGWFSLLVAGIVGSLMLLWVWGSQQKTRFFQHFESSQLSSYLTYEDSQSRSETGRTAHQLMLRNKDMPIPRMEGLALYYTSAVHGLPPVLCTHLTKFPALHSCNIFLTNRSVPVPNVSLSERFLVQQLGMPGFYHVVARYGYMDKIKQGPDFVHLAVEHILLLLYRTLRDVLERNPALPAVTGIQEHLTTANDLAEGGAALNTPLISRSVSLSSHDSAMPTNVAIDLPGSSASSVAGNIAPTSPFAAAAEAGGFAFNSFHIARPAGSAQAVIDAPTRMQLEQVVSILSSQPVDRLVPSQHVTAYKYLRTLAKEIADISLAHGSHQAVYVLGRAHARLRTDSSWARRYLLELPFQVLVNNISTDADRSFGIPADRVCEIGLLYEV